MAFFRIMDGNEAVASVAHRINEVIAIYPITPSSTMGELADEWSAAGRTNIWGSIPQVIEMQSEGGAAGALHGALQAGSLATTFTASQGLLLMIPTLYKLAGELTPACLHVAARTIATHALSIFGDHSDVMAVRQTGLALLASGSVQEAHDFALIGQAASLRARVPVLHFFDGFRTSHELTGITVLTDDDLRVLLDPDAIAAHRRRGLSPDRPVLRGSAQNPDVFFQAREAANPFHDAMADQIQAAMDQLAERTGRAYRLFEYEGHPEAERVIAIMGSGGETVSETVRWAVARGERVGVVKVRLYRPFDVQHFIAALPATTRIIAALDRTKEPGAIGDPLFLDVVAALHDGWAAAGHAGRGPRVIGGRYGLASKEFTPGMVAAILDEMGQTSPRARFTIGIEDDVTHRSLPWDRDLDIEPADVVQAVFWGLGSDGTVGATKNTIKIIGETTPLHTQGYFVYDSKKAGAVTVSHLRCGPQPIRAPWLISRASFVACHQFDFLDRYPVLDSAAPGGTLLLNAPWPADQLWEQLNRETQDRILELGLTVHAIDAVAVARKAGLGGRINTIMQACFFKLAGLLPEAEAIARIKQTIEATYGKRGSVVVARNHAAVDEALAALHTMPVPAAATAARHRPPPVPAEAPDFVQRVTGAILAGHGDQLPVSAFPPDGTWPTATSRWEKRNLAVEIPAWDPKICIQCNWCALVCPHAAIRIKAYDPAALAGAPEGFQQVPWKGPDLAGAAYTVQVAPEDCTGCHLCATVCPAKDKANPRHKALDMVPQTPVRDRERTNFEFFLGLPEVNRADVHRLNAKTSQLFLPLFEYSGACSGCGETPYLKLLTQLFGDRALVANATGCSSIYGGNLPTTPWTVDGEGRGPAWANSLFEDNAEFGFGIRVAVDAQRDEARRLVAEVKAELGDELAAGLLGDEDRSAAGIAGQRDRVAALLARCAELPGETPRRLAAVAESLVPRSVWLVGGDGWAYDIGFGGLDHVLAQPRDVNILVLDTEVYSNTGGQQSKATPLGAIAKFATSGKATAKKDLGMMAMTYGQVYVARVAFGADMNQLVRAFQEAEAYPGPSLIIAYSPCIAHGYDLRDGLEQQRRLVAAGAWPLYRFDPRRLREGLPPLQLDSKPPSASLREFHEHEARFRMTGRLDPARFRALAEAAEEEVMQRWAVYQYLAGLAVPPERSEK
ncbi:MAG: pyruvate:ferredoxin (flavodoxin) oxidoreductase [Gemmatimonadales bacterium]